MRRIAHLSDVHILDRKVGTTRGAGVRYRLATQLVGTGRAIDASIRGRRLAQALAAAKVGGADHVVISGDLTEVGETGEFEHFAEVLHDARFPAGSITLVPGNHDAYTRTDAWKRALEGPLAAFASASAASNGSKPRVVERDDVVFLPIDSTRFQTIAWSGGVFTRETQEALARRLADPALGDRALVLVLHHPPFYPKAASRIVRWVDGLRGCAEVLDLLARHPRLQLLHGHLHRVVDRILALNHDRHDPRSSSGVVGGGEPGAAASASVAPNSQATTRIFGAPATCDGSDDAPRIRFYDVRGGRLRAA